MSGCLLCGSELTERVAAQTDRLYHTTVKEFSVVRCSKCGLARLDPMPPPEELSGYYPPSYWFAPDGSAAARLEESYRRLVLRDHVRFVEHALRGSKARGTLLDVGAGGGLFLGMMKERGFRVAALDFSQDAARVAWKRQGVPSVCALLERPPLRRGSFACVTMFHVLEHLPDPRVYVSAARDLLAPDGRLVVQVPNAASWQARLLGKAWNGLDVPRHLFDFRESDLARLLQSCGFQVLRRKHFSLRDNPAGLASSIAPWLDPMARKIRRQGESGASRLLKDAAYFGLTLGSVPLAALEAAFGAGATVMMEARAR
jgi:SAM-dependent methyltransferase